MGRPSASREKKRRATALRLELQRNIEHGQCAYCRIPARPGKPLTREHVIPRARGGRRKDVRIIVPACAHCNHKRGCMDLIPFLLRRPQRISAFLDYLSTLSAESMRQVDRRVLAELYAAVAIMIEAAEKGGDWKNRLKRLSSGRSLHRRRYAARRAMTAVSDRVNARRDAAWPEQGPTCLLPKPNTVLALHLEESLTRLAGRVISLLAVFWQVPAEVIDAELKKALHRAQGQASAVGAQSLEELATVLPLDGWTPRPRRKRHRVDRRQGRAVRPQRAMAAQRGRAA